MLANSPDYLSVDSRRLKLDKRSCAVIYREKKKKKKKLFQNKGETITFYKGVMYSISPEGVLTFLLFCQFLAKVKNHHVIFTNTLVKQGYLLN